MFGAVAKTYFAERAGIDPAKIVSVSVMPCTAKKAEAAREEMCASGYRDVDVVITTRELGRMIREAGIDFNALEEAEFDSPLGTDVYKRQILGEVCDFANPEIYAWLGAYLKEQLRCV